MHKAASTFVADVLLNSIARRTAYYDLFHVGSFFIRYMHQIGKVSGGNTDEHNKNMLEFLENRPIPKSNSLLGRVYPAHMAIIEQHMDAPLPNEENRLLVMRRDPRDAIVSLFYSLSKSHNPDEIEGNRATFLDRRSNLQRQSVCDGIKSIISSRQDTSIPEFMHCADLILGNNDVCDLPYELLITDPYLWLIKFVEYAEISDLIDDDWLDQMVDNLQPPDVEDPDSHKRRMKPGNWREVFDDELTAIFKERVGERLIQFGYTW